MATINQTLRWGSKGSQVEILQTILNSRIPINKLPNGVKLVVDGIFGTKTYKAVKVFQGLNKKTDGKPLKVDGIVGENTRAVLNKAGSIIIPIKKTPSKQIKNIATKPINTNRITVQQKLIKDGFTKAGMNSDLYYSFLKDTEGIRKDIETLLAGITTADGMMKLAKTYAYLKKLGLSGKQISDVFKQLSKLPALNKINPLDFFERSTRGIFGRFLGTIGKIATKVNYLMVILKCSRLIIEKKYAEMMAEVYGAVMGKLLPFYGLIDALQTFINGIIPKKYKHKLGYFFKILKLADPIKAGKEGVRAAAAVATALYHSFYKKNDFAAILRLERLVRNMKKGSLAVLVRPGENLGLLLYKLSNTREWKSISPILEISCRSLKYNSLLAYSICSITSGLSYHRRAIR